MRRASYYRALADALIDREGRGTGFHDSRFLTADGSFEYSRWVAEVFNREIWPYHDQPPPLAIDGRAYRRRHRRR